MWGRRAWVVTTLILAVIATARSFPVNKLGQVRLKNFPKTQIGEFPFKNTPLYNLLLNQDFKLKYYPVLVEYVESTTEHPAEPRTTVKGNMDVSSDPTTNSNVLPTCEDMHGAGSEYCERVKCQTVYGVGNPICDTPLKLSEAVTTNVVRAENSSQTAEISTSTQSMDEESVTVAVKEQLSRCEQLFGVRSVLCARVPCMFDC